MYTAQTKFRAPRVRSDSVARAALLAALERSVAANPVTLVSAPAGWGKSTLLAQFAGAAQHSRQVLWLSIDADDNDPNRLFAALVEAIEPLGAVWDVDPRALTANASLGGSQLRAAAAALVNALCTVSTARIVLLLDDLHRLERGEPLALIESLAERLRPKRIALLLGSRVPPALPLALAPARRARRVRHGRSSRSRPRMLRRSPHSGSPRPSTRSPCTARAHAWLWPAGLALALGRTRGGGRLPSSGLFEYLAQEVFAGVPADIRIPAAQLDPRRARPGAVRSGDRPRGCARAAARPVPAQPLRHRARRDDAGAARARPVPRHRARASLRDPGEVAARRSRRRAPSATGRVRSSTASPPRTGTRPSRGSSRSASSCSPRARRTRSSAGSCSCRPPRVRRAPPPRGSTGCAPRRAGTGCARAGS
ncbi:MAG: AAA family ATPase [Steroidobacteraceae bacterium]|nr:AAA family ATPase [Steroidobacteraceae bacterium]